MRSILTRPPPSFDEQIRYGGDPRQFAELRFPRGKGPFPLLFVVHGGFWQSAYDLAHTGHLCATLTGKGTITCNLEYRRLGDPGGGWPGTFQDISLATDHILETTSSDPRFDLTRTAILGHSAGGHLAFWLAGRHRVPKGSPLYSVPKQPLTSAVSLAGVCDLGSMEAAAGKRYRNEADGRNTGRISGPVRRRLPHRTPPNTNKTSPSPRNSRQHRPGLPIRKVRRESRETGRPAFPGQTR